jgi:hypothetical protein
MPHMSAENADVNNFLGWRDLRAAAVGNGQMHCRC